MKSPSRRTQIFSAMVLLALFVSACAGAAPEAETTDQLQELAVAYDSSVDIGKTPSLLAWEQMRDHGFEHGRRWIP